jgi:hypothetical protein
MRLLLRPHEGGQNDVLATLDQVTNDVPSFDFGAGVRRVWDYLRQEENIQAIVGFEDRVTNRWGAKDQARCPMVWRAYGRVTAGRLGGLMTGKLEVWWIGKLGAVGAEDQLFHGQIISLNNANGLSKREVPEPTVPLLGLFAKLMLKIF